MISRARTRKLRYILVLFFIFTLVFFTPSVSQVLGAELEAVSSISQAEDSLGAAFLSVLEAERAGGDVSELVARLNVILGYRSKAERALEEGEYETAVFLAEKVIEGSNVLVDDGMRLRSSAELHGKTVFRNQVILSFVVILFTILIGFRGWGLFKGYYVRRMMGLRPEVVADES